MTDRHDEKTVTRIVAKRILSLKASDETDSAFARRIGVSPQVVSNYRSGSNGASLEVLASVVRNTEVSAHWLVSGEGSRFRPPEDTREAVARAVERFTSEAETVLNDLRTRYVREEEARKKVS